MNKFQIWLKAARLRTLPLSLSGIIMGTALANVQGFENSTIFVLALLTTVAFQVTSNFANDYGDGARGTDDEYRIGPKRTIQSGLLSKSSLKKGIILSAIISFILSVWVLVVSFGFTNILYLGTFLILAILSIWAALKYTMGKNPYGYKGFGDVFVFLFFGILAVVGSEFLFTKSIEWATFLPAITIGSLSTGVLNLNNLRDHIQDEKHGKNTLIVKMGYEQGKIYHIILIVISLLSMILYHIMVKLSIYHAFYFVAFIPLLIHLMKILKIDEPTKIDPELKKVALSTFLLALLFYIAVNYFY